MVPRTVLTRRPFNKITAANNSNFTKKVNIVKGTRVKYCRLKVVLVMLWEKGEMMLRLQMFGLVAKAKSFRHVYRNNGASMSFKRFDYIDAQGRFKHIIGNISYLTDYEDIDGGFVAFGGSTKGRKITRKEKIRTGKLDFEDLTDESHVLLKVPIKDNMYNVDLKNVVPQGGLTYLFAKDTPNESNLWHRRLGHVNFKTINKLVRGNLVRGLRSKLFEINQTCVPCQKGKQHRASCRKPSLSFIRPFGCSVTILNTIDHLGKFDGNADEGFFVGYSTNRKAFRVFNSRTRIVEENLHVKFSEDTPNIAGSGPNWLFDTDALTKSMNYEPVVAGNQSNGSACTKACDNVDPSFSSSSKDSLDAGFKSLGEEEKKDYEDPWNEDSKIPSTEESRVNHEKDAIINNTNDINTASSTVNAVGIEDNVVDENIVYGCADDPNMPNLEEIVYSDDDEDVGEEADMTNLDTHILVSPILTTRIHKDHPVKQIIGDIHSTPQTRRMIKSVTDHKPKKVIQALIDLSWIEAMQDELLLIEANRLFLAYASFKVIVYQMDVKSAFLYDKIEEEVYVCQPLGFEDPEFPDRDYKMNKNNGIMPTKIELTLEQSQQGVSNDVLVSIKGVEE
ncbi:ribonuclease H-like domain-containing protein [Tanacetum coccineum]